MSEKIPATFWNASTTSAGRGVALEQRNLHIAPESAPHAYFAWRALPKETWATAGSLFPPSSEDRYPKVSLLVLDLKTASIRCFQPLCSHTVI